MKRFFAFILLLVFMTFKCLTWVPSAAMTGIPAFDAFYYAIMQSLGMAITNGVDIDIAGEIANVRESIPDYLQQPDVALKYLLRDYIGKAWEKFSINLNEIWAPENPYLMNTAAIGISNSSGVSIPTLQDIVAQWEGKTLDNNLQIVVPINSDTVAYWNKYDNTWINTYIDRMNAVPDDVPVQPDLPVTFADYVNLLNGDGFYWKGQAVQYGDVRPDFLCNDSSLVSWFYQNGSFGGSYSISYNWLNYQTVSGLFMSPILTFDITGSDNIYALQLRDSNIDYSYNYDSYFSQYYTLEFNGNIFTNRGKESNAMVFNNYLKVLPSKFNFSGTLEQCFAYLSNNMRNVNVYVNGELWALAGTNYVPNFAATVPNAVIDTGTDDGKIVSNPIYWVVDENTGLPIDSQINLDKFIDYLIGVIDGTNDDTSVNYHDLVDAGVIEKQDGSTISDTEVVSVPIADVIDDSISRADPLSIPVAITGSLPPLPPLPPFFPTPDFPEGDPTSGFNGMSVLARIINITNQSLPDELIITFYGVMFGAIVLGLIKILHK